MLFGHYDYNLRYRREERPPESGGPHFWALILAFFIMGLILGFILAPDTVMARAPRLPGTDETDQLEAAGSLLRIVDSFLFKFGARLMAGLAVLAGGWSIKDMAFGRAVLCFIAAIIMGTAPMWVENIFEMGGGTLFSALSIPQKAFYV